MLIQQQAGTGVAGESMAGNTFTQISRDGTVTVVEFGPRCKLIEEVILDQVNREALDAVVGAEPPLVVFDLTQVEFFGSSFIETLFRVWNRLQQRSGRFALCGLRPYCLEVLQITHLDKLWPIVDTRGDAVAAIAKAT